MKEYDISVSRKEVRFDFAISGIEHLRNLISNSSIQKSIVVETMDYLHLAETAAKNEDAIQVSDHIDSLVLTIRRNLAANISLFDSYNIVNSAYMDVKKHVIEPGQIITEFVDFAIYFETINSSLDVGIKPPYTWKSEGVDITGNLIKESIKSFKIPKEVEQELVKILDQIIKIINDSKTWTNETNKEEMYIELLTEYSDVVYSLRGKYLTGAQVNSMLGMLFFSGTPLYPKPFSGSILGWIILAIAALLFILWGLRLVFTRVKPAIIVRGISQKIKSGGTNTDVRNETRQQADGAEKEDLEEARDRLQEIRDQGNNTQTENARLDVAINTIQGIIDGM